MTNLIDTYLNTMPKQPVIKFDKKQTKVNRKGITIASAIGSATGIITATACIYSAAKKGNPGLKFKNLMYEEKDALLIGAGSVSGGLIAGLIADKDTKNRKPKLREATQQFFGNMACPIGLLALNNRLANKHNVKGIVPRAIITLASLIGGMQIGNKIMNNFNDKVFKEKVKHDVHAEDYLVHADDLCLTANMLLKDIPEVSSVTSKLLPASFIVAGTKTGIQSTNS